MMNCVRCLTTCLICCSVAFAQHRHESDQNQVLQQPRVYLDKSPRIVEYQLNRLSNAQLLLVDRAVDDPRYLPVYRAILLRPGMSLEHREEALAGLRGINRSTQMDELLEAIGPLPLDTESRRVVFRQLLQLLLGQTPEALRARIEELRAGTTSEQSAARIAGFAALLQLGLSEEAVSRAQANDSAALGLLEAVALLPSPRARSQLRGDVLAWLAPRHATVVRQAACRSLASMPHDAADTFLAVAPLIEDDRLRGTAIRTLLQLPKQTWPADRAQTVAERLVEHIESIPAPQRTSDTELDGLQLADDLLALLPAAPARSLRGRLREVTVRVVQLNAVHEEMRYDKPYFAVQSGRPVQVVFRNRDAMPHNLVITAPGALREVAQQASRMGAGPGASGKEYVPDSAEVLFATGMVQPGQQARIVFDAPADSGEYPFVCTFPRHWMRMYGVMVVVDDLDAWLADPMPPADPLGNTREFVNSWSPEDFSDLIQGLRGRTRAIGERLFDEATCRQCHQIQGRGGSVGPDLGDVLQRWNGDHRAVLREVLEPSYKVDPKYAMHTIQTAAGQVLSGVIVAQDSKTVTVVTDPESPQPQVVPRDQIEEMIQSATSMMPKGLLDRFTRDEILELLAFVIASSAQVDSIEHP